MTFSKEILCWYRKNKRDLPWRRTKDPYKIWLSEIMLQQTRVAQGMPYYNKFVENFPAVEDLASASEEKVLKLWQGLGYYSRARNLHFTAKTVTEELGGQFPDTHKGLLKLKGVGDYTASAIASICFDRPEPVVDGNVYRVLARFFGVELPINSTEGVKYFKQLAREVMDVENIRDYNQGIMEFGAIQCSPKSPNCDGCPLNSGCAALQNDKVSSLPVKSSKTKVKTLFFNYIVPISPTKKTVLRQRRGKGIWQNLWEFPLLETEKEADKEVISARISEILSVENGVKIHQYNSVPIVHKLSHRHLYTTFWVAEMKNDLNDGFSFQEAEKFPVPVLIAQFLKTFKNSYF